MTHVRLFYTIPNKLKTKANKTVKRIFSAVKLRPQTPPIDKREIGDAAIPGERRIHTSRSTPPPQLGPLTNERAVSSDVTL